MPPWSRLPTFVRLGPPELPLFGFRVEHTLAWARAQIPQVPAGDVQIWIQRQPVLASVRRSANPVEIHLHSVLNHPETPEEVIGFILLHELLHLVVPPREIGGNRVVHPPEFWEAEKRLAPDREVVWHWNYLVLGEVLRRDPVEECIWVKRGWRRLMRFGRPSFPEMRAFVAEGGGGGVDSAQLPI